VALNPDSILSMGWCFVDFAAGSDADADADEAAVGVRVDIEPETVAVDFDVFGRFFDPRGRPEPVREPPWVPFAGASPAIFRSLIEAESR
jgi:hypothetical protein